MMDIKGIALAVLVSLAIVRPVSAVTLSTVPFANTTVGIFGASTMTQHGTTTFGEKFVAPSGALQSFGFLLTDVSGVGNARFAVAPIDNVTPGAPLYMSGEFALQDGLDTVSGVNLGLTVGESYFAYLTVAGVAAPVTGVTFAMTTDRGYPGGEFLFDNSNGLDPTRRSLNYALAAYDLGYTAVFSDAVTVPEPASVLLLAGVLGASGAVRGRRGVRGGS